MWTKNDENKRNEHRICRMRCVYVVCVWWLQSTIKWNEHNTKMSFTTENSQQQKRCRLVLGSQRSTQSLLKWITIVSSQGHTHTHTYQMNNYCHLLATRIVRHGQTHTDTQTEKGQMKWEENAVERIRVYECFEYMPKKVALCGSRSSPVSQSNIDEFTFISRWFKTIFLPARSNKKTNEYQMKNHRHYFVQINAQKWLKIVVH